jgi:hypothetical protein
MVDLSYQVRRNLTALVQAKAQAARARLCTTTDSLRLAREEVERLVNAESNACLRKLDDQFQVFVREGLSLVKEEAANDEDLNQIVKDYESQKRNFGYATASLHATETLHIAHMTFVAARSVTHIAKALAASATPILITLTIEGILDHYVFGPGENKAAARIAESKDDFHKHVDGFMRGIVERLTSLSSAMELERARCFAALSFIRNDTHFEDAF